MSNIQIKDGAAATKYVKASGAGTNVDPHVPEHLETNSVEMLGTNQDIAVAAQAIQVATEAPLYLDSLGAYYQRVKIAVGDADVAVDVSAAAPLPVTGPVTDAQLRATPVPVSGTVTTTGLTDTQLRATPVPVSGTVTTTLSALPAGTNNIGDVDVLTLPTTPAGVNIIGATYDAGFHTAYTVSRGVSNAVVTSADASAGINITSVPTSGQKLVIVDLVISTNVDLQLDLKEETSGTIFYTFYLKAGAVLQFTPRSKFKLVTADKRLVADTSVAGACSFTASYYSEA